MSGDPTHTLFLSGGGDMGARIRAFDWSQTNLGNPASWGSPLRMALDLCLNSSFPTAIYWGPELRLLYNDAWSPILAEKHPAALGQPAHEVWSDIWSIVGPQLARVLTTGEGFSAFDQMLPMVRGGQPRETFWNYSFTAIRDDHGAVLGVFNQGNETTAIIAARRSTEAEAARIYDMFRQAPGAVAVLKGPAHVFEMANDAYLALVDHRSVVGRAVADVLPEVKGQGFIQLLDQVYQTGQPFLGYSVPVTLRRDGRPDQRLLDFVYQPIRDQDDIVTGIFVEATDVTDRDVAIRNLRINEERLQMALSAGNSIGTWNWDVTNDRVTADRRFAELYGVDPAKAEAGAPIAEFFNGIHPDDIAHVGAAVQAALQTGKPFREEYRLPQPDGTIRWVVAQGRCILTPDGQPERFPGVSYDITDRKLTEDALRESEERFRLVAESAPVMLWMGDATGKCVYLNRAQREFWGLSESDVSTFRWDSTILEEDSAKLIEPFSIGMRTQTPFTLDARFRRADGVFRILRTDARPRFGASGEFLGMIGVNVDVTDGVRATERREALLELSDRLRDLTDPSDIAYTTAEILGRTLGVSRAGYGTINRAAETITIARDWNAPGIKSLAGVLNFRDYGSYIEDLKSGETVAIADARRDPRTASNAEALKAISAQSFVNMPVTEQGDFVALLYLNHANAREWTPDELAFIREIANRTRVTIERRRVEMALHEETTRLQRAETALRESEARFRGITNSVDQMIWSTQPDGYHDFFNDRWYEYTGVPYGSTDGTAWNGIFHPDDQLRARTIWQQSLDSGEPYHIEYRLRHHSGQYRWVLGRAQPVRDADGTITRWFGTCTDIQDIVEAREVLTRSREELEREVRARTRELMAAEEQLRQAQKMEAVGQLTGGIAHDFNNMLAVVIGGLNLLQRRLARGDTDVSKYIDAAMDGATRAASLTQRLLAFSRQQPLAPEPIDANRMVAGMSELLTRSLGEQIRIETVLAAGLWRTSADPVQLENAILNLSVNARDAMANGGKLTIETANTHVDDDYAREYQIGAGQYVLIAVTDTGSGMPPDVMALAFDPFFTTKGVGQGTGLGLSQVFGFVRQSGGHVKLYSEVGVGTVVKIYLPRFYGEAELAMPKRLEAAAGGGHPSEIVLVVEDEERVRAYSSEALRELGYTVITTSGGAEALRILASKQPVTMLFTDVVMPEMTGRELADRALQLRPGLKVLFTTGYTRNAVVHNGVLDAGTNFLPKPFGIDQLAAKVRSVIDA